MGGLGCDNMTVIIVCLLQGGTYSDLASRCAESAVARRNLSPTHEARQSSATAYGGLRDALYGDISEDPRDFDGVPVSKLNDTYTDLDIEIKRRNSQEFEEDKSDDLNSPVPEGVDGDVHVNEAVPHDSQLDSMLQPIETTV